VRIDIRRAGGGAHPHLSGQFCDQDWAVRASTCDEINSNSFSTPLVKSQATTALGIFNAYLAASFGGGACTSVPALISASHCW
jgi:hypothetical protein